MARQVLENGVILPAEYSDDWYDDMTSNLTKLDDVIGSDSEKLSSADVGAAALSNNYNDLDNLPTIPTVNDATLTIQKNGVDVQTFTANASSNVTCNITVPTKTSDLTNDSNFVDTSNPAVASGITSSKVTSYDSHIADTDIHVTTADKNKWNNQTYVFRYSSTALTASSTNANSLLDNTDNLKVGDKVIDSSGVLFSVTAIDTQNSTFTIGTALIDLAQDSDVVHKTGDETSTGFKQFSNIRVTNSIKGINLDGTTTDLNNCYSDFALYGESRGGNIQYYYCSTDAGTANISNLPEAKSFFLISITTKLISNSLCVKQTLVNSINITYTRYCKNGTWGSWVNETDSEYVHKSGNENVGGQKTLVNLLPLTGEFLGTEASNNARSLLYFLANRDTQNQSGIFLTKFRQNKAQGSMSGNDIAYLSFDCLENSVRTNNGLRINFLNYVNDIPQRFILWSGITERLLGTASAPWSDVSTDQINGLEPSSLSLPSDRSARIDISSYFTNTGTGDTNSYTVPANGFIYLSVTDVVTLHIFSQTSGGLTNYGDTRGRNSVGQLNAFLPVRKGDVFTSQWYTTLTNVSLSSAYFIPCQGNV